MSTFQNNDSQTNQAASPTAEEARLDRPTGAEIAERAHSHFSAGGGQHGNDLDHWLAAEADLLAERNI